MVLVEQDDRTGSQPGLDGLDDLRPARAQPVPGVHAPEDFEQAKVLGDALDGGVIGFVGRAPEVYVLPRLRLDHLRGALELEGDLPRRERHEIGMRVGMVADRGYLQFARKVAGEVVDAPADDEEGGALVRLPQFLQREIRVYAGTVVE